MSSPLANAAKIAPETAHVTTSAHAAVSPSPRHDVDAGGAAPRARSAPRVDRPARKPFAVEFLVSLAITIACALVASSWSQRAEAQNANDAGATATEHSHERPARGHAHRR